ncbi:MAG: penicillin-binding protein 1C [Hyphomicrobiaceae bacterium]
MGRARNILTLRRVGRVAGAIALATVGTVALAFAVTPPLDLSTTEALSATVVDRNGVLLRAYTTGEGRWRLPVTVDDVDPRYLAMLKAFEDRRFDTHIGVDPIAMARAAFQAATHGRLVSGGSTLSMQVARLIHGRHERSIGGKIRQMVSAIRLERHLSKTEILNLYLRLAPFGGNVEGIRAASLSYFGKEPRHLSTAEAALLVALPQSPELRRPDRYPAAARRARNHVLDVVRKRGVITDADVARAIDRPVPAARRAFPQLAPHLADRLTGRSGDRAAHAERAAGRPLRTTLDATLQSALQALAVEAAQGLGPRLSVAIVVADIRSADVLAHVGSAGFLDFGRAGAIDMTRAARSPGSTLKPLIYGLAFDAGLAHPAMLIDDVPTRFGLYAPRNFGTDFNGTVTIAHALAASLNIPAVKVLDRLGPGRLAGRLASVGMALSLPQGTAPSLALALGGAGLTLEKLVALYAALAAGGEVRPLNFTVLDEPARSAGASLLSSRSAAQITDILREAPPPPNARGGRIAFKTGTSYGHRDAWSIGYDGRYVIGVWVGRADATAVPELVGRTSAAPILFDAFSRISEAREPFGARIVGAAQARTQDLAPPLQRFEGAAARNGPFSATRPPTIAFPPDLAEVAIPASEPEIVLKATGGELPLTWLVDGKPIGESLSDPSIVVPVRESGFVTLTVIDRRGLSDRATVRIIHED